MKFIIFVIDSESASATSDEMANIDEFNKKLQRNNYWIMAAGIGAPATAKLIDNRDGLGKTESKSNFEVPEFYSGFWIVEVPTNEIASELANEASNSCNRKVELRPFLT